MILEKLKEEKNKYQKAVHHRGRVLPGECNYSTTLETTFNNAQPAWREEVQGDILLTEEKKREKIECLLDFIGPAATR